MRRLSNSQIFLIVCLCIGVALFLIYQRNHQQQGTKTESAKIVFPATRDENMALGNPSKANKSDINNLLIERAQYTLSYNNSKGTANWVSWHLSNAWKGDAPRSENFFEDENLPSACYKVTPKDYSKSGFDRGHLCPSDDRDGSVRDNEATFLMDNIIPQAPKNNQEVWNELESHARRLIKQGNELYIIAGCYGKGGENKYGNWKSTIAKGKVIVPSNVWKILIVMPNGPNDAGRITEKTKVIAVDMPNTQSAANYNWQYYKTSIDAIEAKTGYDFLSNLPVNVQAVIESKVE